MSDHNSLKVNQPLLIRVLPVGNMFISPDRLWKVIERS